MRYFSPLTLVALLMATSPVRADESPAARREAMQLARKLTTAGAATYDSHDAAAMAALYTTNATVKMVGKGEEGYKVTLYNGRAEIEKLYASLFKNDQPTRAKNTVEYARFIAPDMLLITGRFEPDAGSIKVPFVQVRVNHHGQWLMNDLTIFVLPAEKAHASSQATDTNKVARPAPSVVHVGGDCGPLAGSRDSTAIFSRYRARPSTVAVQAESAT
jgi:hypothetical protein